MKIQTCFLLPLFLLLSACNETSTPTSESPTAGKPRVLTTFYPVTYFAQRIAQEASEVICPLPDSADPIYWMPEASAIQQYQSADLILINGANFEQWIDKVTLPSSKLINTSQSLKGQLVRYENAVVHKHGPEGEHSHEGVDGHTWMDPLNALAQAQEIKAALIKRWPEQQPTFTKGYASLETDLQDLDTRFRTFAESWGNRALAASHPAYNYIAKRYSLKIINFDLDPESLPDQEILDSIKHTSKEYQFTHLLWEANPADEVAEAMRKLGLQNILLAPCEAPPESGDYLTTMRQNVSNLEALMK
ncbi:MAG: zinc transport system substrate-binding protein [Verrucomicrobiales bacterium]|jgi:zinc transport system substrate-binding protein